MVVVISGLVFAGWHFIPRWWPSTAQKLDKYFAQLPVLDDYMVREAVERAKQKLIAQPQSAAAWGDLGMTLFANDRGNEALPFLAKAMELDPENPKWPYLQGLMLRNIDLNQALPFFETAAAKCDTSLFPLLYLGETYFGLGKISEAETIYQKIIHYQPDNEYARLGMGRVAWSKNRATDATMHLEYARKKVQTAKAAYLLLANIHSQENNPELAEEAERMAQKTYENGGSLPDAYTMEISQKQVGRKMFLERANDLIMTNQEPEALDLYAKMLQFYPDDKQALLSLGRGYTVHASKEYDRNKKKELLNLAEKCFERVKTVDPSFSYNKLFLYWYGVIGEERALYFDEGFETPINYYLQAKTVDPTDSATYFQLAMCYTRMNRMDKARAALEEGLQVRPNSPSNLRLLGDMHLADGDIMLASYYYRKAVNLDLSQAQGRFWFLTFQNLF